MKLNKSVISIILPTYNEAENIIDLIEEIIKVVKYSKEIIVVDDNSPDGTSALVRRFIQKNKRHDVRIETRIEERGLTKSINLGIKLAKGEVIVWMDCDFSMPPVVVNQLLAKIEDGEDVAVGSRFIRGGSPKHLQKGQKDRLLGIGLSNVLNLFLRLVLESGIYDYTSGFVAVRKEVLKKISLRGDYGEYFIDFIYRAFCYRYKIVEVPYTCLPRRKGESKTGNNPWEYFLRGRKYVGVTLRLLIDKYGN